MAKVNESPCPVTLARAVLARLSPNALGVLEWAGCADEKSVAADLSRVMSGGETTLLDECLRGVDPDSDDGQSVADGHREYVAVLAAHAALAREAV